MGTHGCNSYPCPICHASVIQAAYEQIPPIAFDAEEDQANALLLGYMRWMENWGLNCNQQEMTTAIHTLQMFIIKHMLQRLGAEDFSDWYD